MIRKRSFLLLIVIVIMTITSCSGNGGNLEPIAPSGADDNSNARSVRVQVPDDNYWNTWVGVGYEIWTAHMDEFGRITRALGKGVTAGEPLDFINSNYNLFGVSSCELELKRDSIHADMRFVIYRQAYNEIEVENSLIRLIYGKTGKLVSYGADTWSGYKPSGDWTISLSAAIDIAKGYDESRLISTAKYYWAQDGKLIPAWRIDRDNNSYLIDATSGEFLETHPNRYGWTHEGQLGIMVKPWSPLDDDTGHLLYGGWVGFYTYDQYFSGSVLTDKMGRYSFEHDKRYRLRRLQFKNPIVRVQQAWDSGRTTFDQWDWHNASYYYETVINDEISWSAERNVFYYVIDAYQWFKKLEPSFNLLDFQLPAYVDKVGKCTAYAYVHSDPSIHFFQPWDGCTNTGESPTIVYHEYGHIYVSKMYINPTGALHEGLADTLANSITQHYMVGPDLYGEDTYRRVSNNERKWPAPECDGQVHCVGNVLAGAYWDLRVLVGNPIADYIYHYSNYFNSTDFNEKTADAMLLMDDDDDITNGCPLYDDIYYAFKVQHNLAVPDITNPPTEGVILTVYPLKPPGLISYYDGGSFDYRFRIQNLDDIPRATEIWAVFEMHDGSFYGPVRPPTTTVTQPYFVTLQPYQILETTVEQMIPSRVPLGKYKYRIRTGQFVDHENDILHDESVLEIEIYVK